jgi:hypothetical protein
MFLTLQVASRPRLLRASSSAWSDANTSLAARPRRADSSAASSATTVVEESRQDKAAKTGRVENIIV